MLHLNPQHQMLHLNPQHQMLHLNPQHQMLPLKKKETLVDCYNRIDIDRAPSLLVNIPESQQVVFHQDMLTTTSTIEAVYLGNEDQTIGNNWSQCTAHMPHRAVFLNKTNGRSLVSQGRKQIANIAHGQRERLNLVRA